MWEIVYNVVFIVSVHFSLRRFPDFIVGNMQEFDTVGSVRSNEKMMITRLKDRR